MVHERIFTLKSLRQVKIVFQVSDQSGNRDPKIDYEILIKEPEEKTFRPPIGLTHPKYWKLQAASDKQKRELIVLYSGISRKQIQLALKELNERLMIPA